MWPLLLRFSFKIQMLRKPSFPTALPSSLTGTYPYLTALCPTAYGQTHKTHFISFSCLIPASVGKSNGHLFALSFYKRSYQLYQPYVIRSCGGGEGLSPRPCWYVVCMPLGKGSETPKISPGPLPPFYDIQILGACGWGLSVHGSIYFNLRKVSRRNSHGRASWHHL